MNWAKISGIVLAGIFFTLLILKITGFISLHWAWIAAIPGIYIVFWLYVGIKLFSPPGR